MSLVYSLPCTNPIRIRSSRPKSRFVAEPQVCSTLSTHLPYKCKKPISAFTNTCSVKAFHFFNASVATNAMKIDNGEVLSADEEEITIDFDWGDEEDEGCPWEGAIVYRRNPSITHLEYCTTLERLGLGKISSELSRSRAAAMGLRVTKDVKDYTNGTPVLVSVDITRRKHKLRLDGIIRTVLSLACNRYLIHLSFCFCLL